MDDTAMPSKCEHKTNHDGMLSCITTNIKL